MAANNLFIVNKQKYLKKYILLSFLAVFYSFCLRAQTNGLTNIKGLATKEIYDLLVDKKGFLWIGHDLGLSRFDGISFVDFRCQEQMSLSMTDVVEDAYGRIWSHNFNGQIFYVENEKLHLLKTYNFEKEVRFPRIVLFGDELIATSSKGLFVCNIKTLQSKYINLNDAVHTSGTTSLTVLKNQVIAFGAGRWFRYQKNKEVTRLIIPDDGSNSEDYYLHPVVFKDTIYVTSTFLGYLKKFTLNGHTIQLVKTEQINRFVNTTSLLDNKLWINTKTDSYTTDKKSRVAGLNLTDIVADHEGNTWYSSLKNGLMVRYKATGVIKNDFLRLEKNDFVRSITQQSNLVASGTQNGEIILSDSHTGKTVFRTKLGAQAGAVEKISNFLNGNFLVSASIGSWVLNTKKRGLVLLGENASKDHDFYHDIFFEATANYLCVRPVKNAGYNIERLRLTYFPSLVARQNKYGPYLAAEKRCRALKYDSLNRTLYVALSNGLHAINTQGTVPVMYADKKINASSIAYANGTIYVGDFNRGLMVIKGNHVKNISIEDGLLSNTVLKIKAYNNHLYIIGEKGLQLYDIQKEKVNEEIQLPSLEQGIVYDVLEHNDSLLMATSDGIYETSLKNRRSNKTYNNYLQYAIVNNTDTITNNTATLPYHKNNIQIKLAVPWFNNPQQIYFKYRLVNAQNDDWAITRQGERIIQYAALMPGSYTFEAIATAPNGKFANSFARFNFVINKPWWQQLWATVFALLFVIGAIVIAVSAYYKRQLKKELLGYEKQLAVEIERQRIGAEIHDDIGAGLSALRLYTSLVEEKTDGQPLNADISKIYSSVTHISAQIREVIWTLNTEHDSVENLFFYLEQQATLFFDNTGISLNFEIPKAIPNKAISGKKRREIYLVVKEAFQNIVKHSGANRVSVNLQITDNRLTVNVTDNGIGLSGIARVESSGITNMKKRISSIGGTLTLSSDKGTTLSFRVPV